MTLPRDWNLDIAAGMVDPRPQPRPETDRDPRVDPQRGDSLRKGCFTKRVLDVDEKYVLSWEICKHKRVPDTKRDVASTIAQFRRWARGATVLYKSTS